MNMNDFFKWVQAGQSDGSINKMNSAWQNRNQTPIHEPQKPEQNIEEIPIDNGEE